ncbi:hypothetical protein HER18_12295 [Chryseobacterium sp. NEB161]|nr:hypothetical protein HER18_12295 [Chryseobacterium sp. NEB161]
MGHKDEKTSKNDGMLNNSQKPSLLIVEQNMNFNEVFVEHCNKLPYKIGNFFTSWDLPFQYTWTGKIRNLIHRNFLGNKNYLDILKEEQYNRFCRKCIKAFEKKFPGKFDYCLLFRADRLPQFLIEYFRSKSKLLVAYQYDGLSVCENILSYTDYLDKIYVFDPYDISKFKNKKLSFVTNFHFSLTSDHTLSYFFYYLGTWVDARYENLNNLLQILGKTPLPNRLILATDKQISANREILTAKNHMPFKDYLEDIKGATILIDIKAQQHDGLSFRFFESLNLRKKLITDNKSVINYNFYHPDNIFITDYENFDGLEEFMSKPYHPVPKDIVNMYSLDNWIKNVFEIDDYVPIPEPKNML